MIKKTKIAFVIPALYGGGAENHFRQLVSAVFTNADRHIFFHGSGSDLIEGIEYKGLGKKTSWDYFRPSLRLAGMLRKGEYDIVIAFSRDSDLMTWLAVKLFRANIRIITRDNTQIFRRMSGTSTTIKGKLWIWLLREIFSDSDLVLTNSNSAKLDIVKHCRLNPQKVGFIGNPINIEQINLAAGSNVNIPCSLPYLITVGRLCGIKRYDIVIDAFNEIKDKIPHNLVLVGDGPLAVFLQNKVDRMGLSNRVFFLGWINRPFSLIKQSAALVMSSECEGLPNVVIEAFALGKPVVATICTSWIDEFEKQNACLGVKINDVSGLANTLLKLIENKTLQIQLSSNARQIAENFSIDKIAYQFEILVKKVLQ